MYQYNAFGLKISCQWPLFQLPTVNFASSEAQVTIARGRVDDTRFNQTEKGEHFQVYEQGRLAFMQVREVANFLIENGTTITVDVDQEAVMQTVNLYLLGSGLGTILHQRGSLPLHGNGINIDGHAVIVTAHSGIGKSTLASEFYRRGYSLLADDVCAVSAENEVQPSYPFLKLWQEAIDRLDLPKADLIQIMAQKEKFYVPLGVQFNTSSLPLKSIYILMRGDIDSPEMKPLKGVNKLLMLRPQIYRLHYLRCLVKGAPAMDRMSERLGNIPVFHVVRPVEGMHVEQIADMILANEADSGST